MTRSFLCISREDLDIHKSKHYIHQNKFPMLCETCLLCRWVFPEEPKATSWGIKKKKKNCDGLDLIEKYGSCDGIYKNLTPC